MLTHLHIENYAIIEHLDIDLYAGLNTVTGQTGAGKSILLGALGLLSGAKAEPTVIGGSGDQLIVEGEFDVSQYGLQGFFEANDLDYSDQVSIRRVVSRAGKSRAFVDTTPVTLSLLKDLTGRLVDIHSQHETLLVVRSDFQREIVDAVASNAALVGAYSNVYNEWRAAERELKNIIKAIESGKEREEYLAERIEKLDALGLKRGECEALEAEGSMLSSAEDIALDLATAAAAMEGEDTGILALTHSAAGALARVAKRYEVADELSERLQSVYIELKDIASEVEAMGQGVVANPLRLEAVNSRLDAIYSAMKRYETDNADELLDILVSLKEEYMAIEGGQGAIERATAHVAACHEKARAAADKLSRSRKSKAIQIERHVLSDLEQLGIRGAKFSVDISQGELSDSGADLVRFLFAGGAAQQLLPLERVASGGEMSRVMLSLKGLVAKSLQLPTIVFDEIDTGVSGAVAQAMGLIIEAMGSQMQVINITHLAQVASRGEHHFLVYKDIGTHIKELSSEERVEQIASMLSGAQVTDAARLQAQTLLKN